MDCLITLRIHDESPDALMRLGEHVLRAQRLAWISDGILHDPAKSHVKALGKDVGSNEAALKIEHEGRVAALKRAECAGYTDGLHDATVQVADMSHGSLRLELLIPATAVVAIYFANLYANDQSSRREFEARLRTVNAVVKQMEDPALPSGDRKELAKSLIDAVGAFDNEIVDSVTLKFGEYEISVDSRRGRKAPD